MNRDRNTSGGPANQGDGTTGPQGVPAVQPPFVVQPPPTGQPPPAIQHLPSVHGGTDTSLQERLQIVTPQHSGNSASTGHRDARPQSSSSPERLLLGGTTEGFSTFPRSQDNPYVDFERVTPPPPARSREGQTRGVTRRGTRISLGAQNTPGLDWIVPVDEKSNSQRTVGDRLQPTIEHAIIEKDKYAQKALWTGYALNIAIGMQVLLGALTTGLAAAVTDPRHAQIATSLLGGMSTMVASYLARARGSNEPELSITRVKDLEQFLRESKAFQMDHAHEYGSTENGLNQRLDDLRQRFEALLGNANGERKLSPVGVGS
ncbi:hypothetical protein PAXRUDRAFT_832365 [Paxillus rubicundulus Ve08.2h10]|uniref:SMODS and SLOG-associating 2TM effector domain-containing protein n=1 Tax=Paxillus rubicundulus Ve08.2h10 TaxID=930991 RepID=A0A0D0CHI0_9AGAM|nr:hypothetical protein PAXRUDRAFT_832365 [Paxillus rubicundulus Ve08.2h10]